MRKANSHAVLGAGVIALGVLAFAPAPASAAPFAVLSDWVGVNNTTAPNDYGLISPTSAGGIFEERKTPRAQFADESLVGGPFGFESDLSITGTLSFTNPATSVDPQIVFGFHSSTGSTIQQIRYLGIGFGNGANPGFFRAQALFRATTTVAATGTMDTNGTAAGGDQQLAEGTYPFALTYTAETRVYTASVGPVSFGGTLAATFDGLPLEFDRFGFLQPSVTTAGEDETFTFTVSDINYTGETVPEPATLGLIGAAGLVALRRGRRSRV